MHVKIITDKSKPGSYTVVPHGPIDSDTYLDFNDQISPLLKPDTMGIVVDLANVEYISSAGLGVLFTMKKFLKQKGSELLFSNLKPQIVKLFEVVNALPKETLFRSTEEADAYLYKMIHKKDEAGEN